MRPIVPAVALPRPGALGKYYMRTTILRILRIPITKTQTQANMQTNNELQRLAEAYAADATQKKPWLQWGPYLSERQWGTVREDYSADGNAWDYFTHDQARSRAYRWGEDGLAGLSDKHQNLCFSFAFWNEKDPILKERLFGLTNG